MNTETKFEGFAIVEIMGHNTIAGYISEQVIAGAAMVRVDVPACEEQPAFTKFLGGSSIYGITPTTEDIVKVAVKRLQVRPVSNWVVPTSTNRQLVDSTAQDDDYDDEKAPF
jgi:hypothetical protein